MFESKQKCIANCLEISKGSHALYRSLGMQVVDSASTPFVKRSIQENITKYFPDVNTQSVKISAENIGLDQFIFDIILGDSL